MKILCSTGALIGRPNNRDYRLFEGLSKELTCDGFEFMMYSSWYDEMDDIISYLKGINIYIPVVHCEKHIGQAISAGTEEELIRGFDLFEKNCCLAKELSAEKLVLHLWDGTISDRCLQGAGRQLRNRYLPRREAGKNPVRNRI